MPVAIVEEYDPNANKWTKKTEMLTPRYFLSTCVMNERIYAIGGIGSGHEPLPTVEIYDPVTDTWTKEQDLPNGRYNFAATSINGKIYVIGGMNFNKTVLEYNTGFAVDAKDKLPTSWGNRKIDAH
jgi:N-acetylneuraminic acid mutarotase